MQAMDRCQRKAPFTGDSFRLSNPHALYLFSVLAAAAFFAIGKKDKVNFSTGLQNLQHEPSKPKHFIIRMRGHNQNGLKPNLLGAPQ